ncbi:winged helix-turn-helix domain-containing protein [Streptomyces sp. NPDC013455]|uniref:ArsR/SmtB family transcription factor n=1 Tax=Streptomyces sp. NPDC013455 TaxID=3155605 RepID=UPI0033FA65D0
MLSREVRLESMERVSVRVSRHPGATLFSIVKDVFADRLHGVPEHWRKAVRAAVPAHAAAVVGPVLASRDAWLPDRLALIGDLGASAMPEVLTGLAETDPHQLAEEVAAFHSPAVPSGWRPLMDDPVAFLRAYRLVVEAAWEVFAPLWRHADPYLGREAERIGFAAVTGGLDGLLTGLDSKVRYEEGVLRLPHGCPRHLTRLGGRPLVLVPLASGHRARMYGADREDALWIGYPVPGFDHIAGRSRPGSAPPAGAPDGLTAVLGEVRAEILKRLPHSPTVSELARHLHLGVSTTTYHCQHLAAAGLLLRERHGREVRLLPTERGVALVHLLTAPFPRAPRR